MAVDYVPQAWADEPLHITALSSDRMMHIENGLVDMAAAINALITQVAGQPTNFGGIDGVYFTPTTPTAASLLAAGVPTNKTTIVFSQGL